MTTKEYSCDEGGEIFFENDWKIFVLYGESFLYSQCDLKRVKS